MALNGARSPGNGGDLSKNLAVSLTLACACEL